MDKQHVTVSVPFLFPIGLLLIMLKFAGVISWEWWIILMPFWVPMGIAVILLCLAAVLAIIAYVVGSA